MTKKLLKIKLAFFLLIYFVCTIGQGTVKSNNEIDLTAKPKIEISDNSVQNKLSNTNSTNLNIEKDDSFPKKQSEKVIQKDKTTAIHTVSKNNIPIIDTTRLSFTSSGELTIPIATNGLTKVVMIKEKSKFDFFRYLLPIFTLLLGIYIKEVLDERSEKKKIKKSGERWVAELRSIEEPLIKQIQTLKEFNEEHKKGEFTIPRIKVFSSLNGEVFKSLDKNELIQFIQMNNEKSEFNEIVKISNRTHGYISLLVHLYESLNEKFNKYLSQTSTYVDALNSSLQSFGVAFADYGVELETEIGADFIGDVRFKPLEDLYSAHIFPHIADGKFNPFILKDEFFMPVLNVLSHNRLDIRTKPMLIAVNTALNSIKGIEMEKHYMTEIINKMIGYYQSQLEHLDGTIEKISKSTIS